MSAGAPDVRVVNRSMGRVIGPRGSCDCAQDDT